MSAEGRPQEDDSRLARPLAGVTRWVVRRPVVVLAASAVLALVSVAYAAGWLGFRTSRLDLLNPDSAYNKLWIEYIEEFGDQDDAVVVIEGAAPEMIAPVKRELAERLARETGFFDAVLHEVDLAPIRAKGLHFLTREQLAQLDAFVMQAQPLVQGDWASLNFTRRVRRLNEGLAAPLPPQASEATRREVEQLVVHLGAALQGVPPSANPAGSPLEAMEHSLATLSQTDSQYLRTRDGWMGFILLRLAPGERGATGGGNPAIARLREILAEAQSRHSQTRIGLTGMPVLEDDEMRASQQDMTWASLISLVGVAALFMVAFGGWRHPLLCMATLLLGMAWSVGYLTLAVGHLNLLSVAFGVILIGLGIDFGIHYLARYLHLRCERHRHTPYAVIKSGTRSVPATLSDVEQSLIATGSGVGPGIITGAVTTAIAFFTAALTDFTGIAELGVIAGGGILLCCVAALTALPAMIAWVDQSSLEARIPQPLDLSPLAGAMRRPKAALVVSLGITGLLLLGLPKLRYDHNLLNLQPDNLESVLLEKKLLQETDKSVWFAISIADSPEELKLRKRQFEQLPMVDRTEEIASLLPARDDEKQAIIARLGQRLRHLPERPPWLDVDPPELLGTELARLQQTLAASGRGGSLTWRLEELRAILRQLTPRQYYERLSPYQQTLAGETLSRLHLLRSMADPEPPQLADLPRELRLRFVGKHNRHLLRIYGRGDIWEIEALEQFVRQVKSVDPHATGHPLQTYYASRQMQQSYIHAAIYAFAAVAIVVFLDFRSVRHALLSLVPMGLGMAQMFGLMGLLDLPLNPANTIVLPLLLGIGIDDGVHIMHDFRTQTGRFRLTPSTTTAVTLTSLTTIIGFGSMLLAGHQGLRSLGLTLVIGVACCLFSSLAILPPLLALLRDDEAPPAEQSPPAPLALRRRAA